MSGSQVGKSEGLRQIAMEVSLLLTCCFISLILRFISLRTLTNTQREERTNAPSLTQPCWHINRRSYPHNVEFFSQPQSLVFRQSPVNLKIKIFLQTSHFFRLHMNSSVDSGQMHFFLTQLNSTLSLVKSSLLLSVTLFCFSS